MLAQTLTSNGGCTLQNDLVALNSFVTAISEYDFYARLQSVRAIVSFFWPGAII